MKRLVAALVLVAAPLLAAPLELRVGNGLLLRADGATAAYTLDSSIADAALRDGSVTLFGHAAGTTKLVLVFPSETRTVDVVVTSPAGAAAPGRVEPPRRAVVESRYSSGAAQVTNSFDVVTRDGERRSALHVMNVRYLEKRYGSLGDAFPSISYQIATPRRTLTFFDSAVDNSPLTLSNVVVRGAHLEQGGWRLHAGYTGPTFYDGLVLPAARESVAGISYSRQITPAWRLMPSVYAFPSHTDATRRGAVASLLLAFAPGDWLHVTSELGFSRGAGAALQLDSITANNRVRADIRWQGRDFAIAGPSTLRGFYSDLGWSGHYGRLSTEANYSWNDYMLRRFEQRSVASAVDLRYRLSAPLALLAGARYTAFQGTVPATARVDNLVIPAGAALDFAHAGATAVVRFGRHSADGATRGFRITGRLSAGAFSATAYVDRQRDTPTLQLIYQQRPDLALALERLGFEASTPNDIARLLRDNAPLINLGLIEGASVNLTPRRDQAGLELAWNDASAARQRLRLRVFSNRTESVAAATTSSLAMLSYSRRLFAATDVEASVARFQNPGRTSFELAVRHSFDDLPRFGGGNIEGVVTLDQTSTGLAGVDVQLDATRTSKTDAKGRYAFANVGRGVHQVTARLPRADAFFTGPSRVDAVAGDVVDFGMAYAGAQATGHVVSDAGIGVGGVHLIITAGARQLSATTDSDGKFVVAASGPWSARIDAESLPIGYVLSRQGELRLDAIRTISGRIIGARGAEVEARPTGKRVIIDREGRFAFRALPAGTITLVTRAGDRTVTASVALPAQPTTVDNVEIAFRPQSERVSATRTERASQPSGK